MLEESYTLNNGIKIPKLGLGTWLIKNDRVTDVVKEAIRLGYRHIDTAQAYGNEEGIGKALKEVDVKRNELFITTKVHAEFKSYYEVRTSVLGSLEKLGLDYIDLVLIHSPQKWEEFRGENRYFKENIEVWKALEDLYNEGLIKAIGVSNFLVDDLKNLLNNCKIKPMVNQVLAHIANVPFDVVNFCKEKDILIEAYSPIAHGAALNSEDIKAIAKKYNVSVPNLCIKYTLQLGFVSLPKTDNFDHLKSNIELDFVISDGDMEVLNNLHNVIDYGDDKRFPVFGKSN